LLLLLLLCRRSWRSYLLSECEGNDDDEEADEDDLDDRDRERERVRGIASRQAG
jgi:hypothetical protein